MRSSTAGRRGAQRKKAASHSPRPAPSDNYDGALVKWRNHSISTPNATFGQIRYQPGGFCGPRIQRDYQLVVVHSGECTVDVDGKKLPLPIGQASLFRPGSRELFQFSKTSETCHSWCTVRPAAIPEALRRELDAAPLSAGLSLFMATMIRSVVEYASAEGPHGALAIEQTALALFSDYLRACEGAGRVPPDISVTRALRYMDLHFDEADCLVRACRASACSRTALIKKFHRCVGQTPGRHLWQLRTERGIALLRNTGLTVAEISEQCGFSNPYHFSRRVSSITGRSPRSIRDEAWGRSKAR